MWILLPAGLSADAWQPDWLLIISASRQADLCVSPVSRLVPPQLLPTPLSCCHVAMATWEGPAFTTPGSQRRSLVWGTDLCIYPERVLLTTHSDRQRYFVSAVSCKNKKSIGSDLLCSPSTVLPLRGCLPCTTPRTTETLHSPGTSITTTGFSPSSLFLVAPTGPVETAPFNHDWWKKYSSGVSEDGFDLFGPFWVVSWCISEVIGKC